MSLKDYEKEDELHADIVCKSYAGSISSIGMPFI